jgi:hypothetical protein
MKFQGRVEVYLCSSFNFGGLVVNATTWSFYLRKKEIWYLLYRMLDGPQTQFAKNLTRLGFDPRTAHSIATRYTDYAILTHQAYIKCLY